MLKRRTFLIKVAESGLTSSEGSAHILKTNVFIKKEKECFCLPNFLFPRHTPQQVSYQIEYAADQFGLTVEGRLSHAEVS